MNKVKDMARQKYAWPGGYTLVLLMSDGDCLCHDCLMANYRTIRKAQKEKDNSGWRPADVFIHWEGPELYCANCNKTIESEYGNPWEETA